jgi:hypothetical protein
MVLPEEISVLGVRSSGWYGKPAKHTPGPEIRLKRLKGATEFADVVERGQRHNEPVRSLLVEAQETGATLSSDGACGKNCVRYRGDIEQMVGNRMPSSGGFGTSLAPEGQKFVLPLRL